MGFQRCLSLGTLAATCLLVAGPSYAWQYDKLSSEEKNSVDKTPIFKTETVQGSPWNRLVGISYVDATPEQAAAWFTHYENIKKTSSLIVDLTISDNEKDGKRSPFAKIEYTIKVDLPVIPFSINYKVDHVISEIVGDNAEDQAKGKAYEVVWNWVKYGEGEKKNYFKGISGSVRFEPAGSGTLMIYTNYADPYFPGISFFRAKIQADAGKAFRETVINVRDETKKSRLEESANFDTWVKDLREALAVKASL